MWTLTILFSRRLRCSRSIAASAIISASVFAKACTRHYYLACCFLRQAHLRLAGHWHPTHSLQVVVFLLQVGVLHLQLEYHVLQLLPLFAVYLGGNLQDSRGQERTHSGHLHRTLRYQLGHMSFWQLLAVGCYQRVFILPEISHIVYISMFYKFYPYNKSKPLTKLSTKIFKKISAKFSKKFIEAFRAFGWARRAAPMSPMAAALRRS